MSSTRCSDLRWCYLQQTVHFFQSDTHPVIPNKLAFTSLHCSISNYTFDRRDSDLINLRTNMIQINIRPKHLQFAITNQIWWDLPRTVNETYLVWLMFQVLSNQHYPHRTNQTLRSWANAVFQNRGVCGQVFPPLLSPSPVISFFFFFALVRTFSTVTLATQASQFQLGSAGIDWCITISRLK